MGAEHPSTLVAMHNVAELQNEIGKHEAAEKIATETLVIRVRLRGEEHPYTQETHWLLAKILARRGAYDEALKHLQTAVDNGFVSESALESAELPVFNPLRRRPEFETLLATMKKRSGKF